MNANDEQPAESESQSSYEAAVLDFLDKEMANVQSAMTEKKQAEELDALVADLLQQVMTESDQLQLSGEMPATPEDIKDLIAEFPPQQETVSPPKSESAPPEPELESELVQEVSISAGEDISVQETAASPIPESPAEPSTDVKASLAPVAALFSSQSAPQSRMPMIAAAIVCVLAVIGVAIYYFSGLPGNAPASDAAQTAQASAQPQPPVPAVAGNLIPAVAISQVSPKYPEFALRTDRSAAVVLELAIDNQGKVVKATPVSGPEMFHKEAVNAAMQWRYRPASVGGTNVSSHVKVTFNFNLKK